MRKPVILTLFFAAVFLQAGAYGLTFLLPDLFAEFGADEKNVGQMLFITTFATLLSVYYAGHLSDWFGRLRLLGIACLLIGLSLFLYGMAKNVGIELFAASAFLGIGWGITYSLCPVVLTRLVGEKDRVRYFAALSIFVMAGFGLSPVVAAFMISHGYTVSDAFYLVAASCVVSAVLFFVLVGPVREFARTQKAEARSSITILDIKMILKSKARLPIIMVFLGASVFAGLTNFQTVFAAERGLSYSNYFLAYTLTVIAFRLVLLGFNGGRYPYLTIAMLQYIMCASVVLFIVMGNSQILYVLVAVMFGLGYGASYPILVAMAAADARDSLMAQTLQLFALTYFIGIFAFPLVAGWMIVEIGITSLLIFVACLAALEASMAIKRWLMDRRQN